MTTNSKEDNSNKNSDKNLNEGLSKRVGSNGLNRTDQNSDRSGQDPNTRNLTGSVRAGGKVTNNVRKLRMARMMSKAELARRAGISSLTVDRVERGLPCRMDTKRKILEALSLTPADRVDVFGADEEG